MLMNLTVGDVGEFPGKRGGSGYVKHACAVEKVWLDDRVGRIEESYTVGDEEIPLVIRREWTCCHAPEILIILLHRNGLGNTLESDGHLFDVGSAAMEGDTIVGLHFGGNERRRLGKRCEGSE
jgi:hypothetical protein